jgi:hypothetical protein
MILVKTEAGHQVLRDRSIRLTPRQRSAFILFDGKRSVAEVLAAGTGTGREEINQMVELGLLGPTHGAREPVDRRVVGSPASDEGVDTHLLQSTLAATSEVELAMTTAAPRSSQQRYQDGYQVATRLTASLGLRGFRLNLAVEGSSSYEQLRALAPKIRAAVGPEKAAMLDRALDD